MEHLKIILRGLFYLLCLIPIFVVTSVVGLRLDDLLFAKPCLITPENHSCPVTGLLPPGLNFRTETLIKGVIFFVPGILAIPFSAFSHIWAAILGVEVRSLNPTELDSGSGVVAELGFYSTIVYYLLFAIIISYYRNYPYKKKLFKSLLFGFAAFHLIPVLYYFYRFILYP